MPIFYLEPKDGDTSHPRWETTSLKEGCWVMADSEGDARQFVQMATLRMTDFRPGEMVLFSPWLDGQLVSCSQDTPSIDIPEGIIVTASGKTIS